MLEIMKVPNENISETLCFFCEYRIKSSRRQRFSTVIRKKIASANGRITSIYTQEGMITVVPQQGPNKTPFHLGLHSDFSERLCQCNYGLSENSNAVLLTTGEIRRWKIVGEYLNIWVLAQQREREPNTD